MRLRRKPRKAKATWIRTADSQTQSHVCAKIRWTRRHVGGVIKRLLPCCTLVHIDTLLLIKCPLFMINLIFSRNVMRTRRRDAW